MGYKILVDATRTRLQKVSILNGGFRQWLALGLPTEAKITAFQPASFCPSIKEDIFVDKNYVLAAIDANNHILINALTKDIHDGLNPTIWAPWPHSEEPKRSIS